MAELSLSVLIPNYDWDVTKLVKSAYNQLVTSGITFEILIFDNAIDSAFHSVNEELNTLSNVLYRVNTEHFGRAQNRNALARNAKHTYLLFIDGDAGLEQNASFISNYLKEIQPEAVLCGGTSYNSIPASTEFMLRYVYGKAREEIRPEKRQQNPWAGFSAFNFLIERSLFLQFGFDESMSQYGHEDTLFGNELKYRCIAIKHINNTAEHCGLDSSTVFLAKSRQAVENLGHLILNGLIDEDVKLYAWYVKLHKARMTSTMGSLFSKFHKKWERNLCGAKPSLVLFDLYRLCYLCTLPVKHRTAPAAKI